MRISGVSKLLLTAATLAACGSHHDPAPGPDAEVAVRYDGTTTIHPHGSMESPMMAASVSLSTTAMYAGGCTITRLPDDNGALSFGCPAGGCPCDGAVGHVSSASATVAGTMLTAHWSALSFDDELTDYDFSGTQAP